jgi:hypothetical protein
VNWLLWRQHRSQLLVTSVVLALFAVVVLFTGLHMAHVYDDALRSCEAGGTCAFIGNLFQGDGAIVDLVHLSIAVPLILGAVLGAPLIARETEHSTNVLVWTQSVTRRRWLFAKVAMAVAATLVIAAAVSALVTWWSGTPNSLYGNRFEGAQFDTQNVLPVVFALFAVALGIAAGSLFRRSLPAIAATVGVYAAVRVLVAVYVRPHYMKSATAVFGINAPSKVPSGSWTLSQSIMDRAGRSLSGNIPIPSSCRPVANGRGGALNCLSRLGYRQVVKYQPASHYWQFQWTEAALFLVLATALVTFALVHTLRRDA